MASDKPIPAEVVRADRIRVGEKYAILTTGKAPLCIAGDVVPLWTRGGENEPGWIPDQLVARILPAPALRAEDLPVGTVMVLGKRAYSLSSNGPLVYSFIDDKNENLFWPDELQELIDRGVEFRLPEGGGK